MNEKIALKGCMLFDGVSQEVIKEAVIKIRGEVIEYAGSQSGAEIESDYEVIDVSGKLVMPGIIDCHVHLCGILNGDALFRILEPNEQQAMVAVKQAEKILSYGITTVGDVSRSGLHLKNLINAGILSGPRILACGPGLTKTGGAYVDLFSYLTLDYVKENHPWGIPCDGADNLRHEIRDLQRRGCDGIKIWATGGSLCERKADSDRIYSNEELKAIYEETKAAGLVVFVHCESIEGTKAALKQGFQCILHGVELDDECIDLMLKNNACFMPTIKINLDWIKYHQDSELLRRKGLSEYEGESLQEKEYNRTVQNFKNVCRHNIRVVLASDTYCEEETPYGQYSLDEIKTFVKLGGMSEAEAILSATRYGAEVLHIEDRIGSIEAGKLADLIVIDGNPLVDIDDLSERKMVLIMKGGRFVKKFI